MGSREQRPPTVRSPMVTRNVLSATVGWRRTRRTASARSIPSAVNGGSSGVTRATSRVMRGGLPRSAGRSMSTGLLSKSGSRTSRCWSSVASPTTAKGQRSRSQIARKTLEPLLRDGEDVALLGLVAPHLARGHARLFVGCGPQVDPRPPPGAVGQLRQRVREPARPHVVDGEDRVVAAQGAAAVDHLLGPALDLGVAALDRVEVEVGGVGAGGHGGGRPAAHADQHPRPADLDEEGAGRDVALVRVLGPDVAHAPGDHDRLVVAADRPRHLLLVGPEVARRGWGARTRC